MQVLENQLNKQNKTIQEEVTLMNTRKEAIKDKIKEIENDFTKFKNEVKEKELENFKML
jgi:hypothetical protein